ncbi:uroporphyrinogen-III synthase [Ideonella sp. A 288]|uniref:uroporphyrinogen-III synthase n=1 Tax=Ideonella sp. A 288 TaxID=1962181 RepID=UPI000B4B2C45|nr:uroporphyrinogen-III synthase [Ideonella sp. A 288]
MRVLVTRPQPQADEWVARLQALGVDAAAFPLLGIEGPADPQAVPAAWDGLSALRLAMFVSPSAVERFFALAPAGRTWPPGVLAGGTGPGTAVALASAGVPAAAIVCPGPDSERFDSEALWQLLRQRGGWQGACALIVRGEGGRDWLADTLRGQGATVQFVEAYRRVAPRPDAAGQALLVQAQARPAEHVWLFSSSEAVHHLPPLAPQADWSAAWALATHPRIAQAARDIGIGRVEAVTPSPEAVAAHLTRSIQSARS